jgi:hypothetical protein
MPRFTWSETAIAEALQPVVSELGRMPSRAELKDRGLAGAWDAMRRRGGIDAWAGRLTANGTDPSDAIRQRAYFLSLDSPETDPTTHWLQAERELAAA